MPSPPHRTAGDPADTSQPFSCFSSRRFASWSASERFVPPGSRRGCVGQGAVRPALRPPGAGGGPGSSAAGRTGQAGSAQRGNVLAVTPAWPGWLQLARIRSFSVSHVLRAPSSSPSPEDSPPGPAAILSLGRPAPPATQWQRCCPVRHPLSHGTRGEAAPFGPDPCRSLPACPFPSSRAGRWVSPGSPGLSPGRKQKRAPFSAAVLEPAAGRQEWGTELPGLALLLQRPARVTPLPPGPSSTGGARGEDGNEVHLVGLREMAAGGEPRGLGACPGAGTDKVRTGGLFGGRFWEDLPRGSVSPGAGPGSPSMLPGPAGVRCTWEHSLRFSWPWQEEKGALITCLGEARFR